MVVCVYDVLLIFSIVRIEYKLWLYKIILCLLDLNDNMIMLNIMVNFGDKNKFDILIFLNKKNLFSNSL